MPVDVNFSHSSLNVILLSGQENEYEENWIESNIFLGTSSKVRHGIYRYKYMYIYTREVQLEALTFYASAKSSKKENVQNVKHN